MYAYKNFSGLLCMLLSKLLKISVAVAGGMAQQLEVLAALTEDSGLILRTNTMAHNRS